jgi:hypothetical protein
MKRFIFFSVFIIVFFFIILIAISLFVGSNSNNNIFSIPTQVPKQEDTNAVSGVSQDTDPAQIEANRRSGLVYGLIEKTPYIGKNFSFYYSFSNDQFTVYINNKNFKAGEEEFENFLKQNGVDDKSWITNLVTTTSPVTPAP